MTDDERARALLKAHNDEIDYIAKDGMSNELYDDLLLQRILAYGRNERRRVWEEVIAEVAKNETVSPFIGPLWNAGWTERSQSLLKWCRQQAEARCDHPIQN